MGDTMEEAECAPKMTVRLLKHKRTKRVLYMEAGKDFVDLLLSFLVLPVGTILTRLATSKPGFSISKNLASIANVADSVRKLEEPALYVEKSDLLTPAASDHIQKASLLQLEVGDAVRVDENPAQQYFRCSYANCSAGARWIANTSSEHCPSCRNQMRRSVWMAEVQGPRVPRYQASQRKTGFVKKNLTFMVTDALEILPVSTITSIDLLNKLEVQSMRDLESCEADVGANEALKLLARSFCSWNVLNDVFGSGASSSS